MLAQATFERPSVSWISLLGAFFELKRIWPVEEQPTRTTEPAAWVHMDSSEGMESLLGVVFPVPDDNRLVFLPVNGREINYSEARYLINPDPALNPMPPVKGNTQPYDKVGEMGEPVSRGTQKWLRRCIEADKGAHNDPIRTLEPICWVSEGDCEKRLINVGMVFELPSGLLAFVPVRDNRADMHHARYMEKPSLELQIAALHRKGTYFTKDEIGDQGAFLTPLMSKWLARGLGLAAHGGSAPTAKIA